MKKWLLLVFILLFTMPVSVFGQADAIVEGEALLEEGEFEEALDVFSDVLADDAENVDALIGRSEAYVALGEPRRALADAKRAVVLAPSSAEAYIARGTASLAEGDVDPALEDLEEATRLDPENAEPFFLQAQVYGLLGETDQALANYDAAIEIEPQNAEFLYNRGQLHYALGELEAALSDYTTAIKIDPDNPDYYFSRAFVYFDLGDFESTIEDDNMVIELAPEFPSGHLNRGFHYYSNGDFDQASVDYYNWILLGETERFDLDEIEKADRLELEMDEGWAYYIPFTAPEAAAITVEAISPGGLVDPVVVILDADGEPIMVDDDGGMGFAASLESYALPDQGEYTLVLSHAGGGSVGEVILDVEIGREFGNA